MDLGLSEDQRLLKDSVERFLGNEYAFDVHRALLGSDDGFSREHWARYGELGWLAAPFAEDDGGLGGGAVEVMIVMEQMGRALALEPYLATVLLAGRAIVEAASPAQRAAWIPEIVAGKALWAFAHGEPGSRYDLAHVETRAEADGSGYRLSGHKAVVHGAAAADHLLVSARETGAIGDRDGISMFAIPRGAAGLTLRPYRTVDGLRAAEVALDGVVVAADDRLGAAGAALPVIEAVFDRAIAALCAEAVGIMDFLYEATVEFLKTRKQFGVPIGKFQVLQHRAVEMMAACQEARSLSLLATLSLDKPPAARARAVSAAKVGIGKSGRLVGQEAIQMHGGMDMTDELKVGHYFKRLTMIDAQFGNVDHHLDRFAALGD